MIPWGSVLRWLRPRLAGALRGFSHPEPPPRTPLPWDDPDHDVVADIKSQISKAEADAHLPFLDPEAWEACKGLWDRGLCYRFIPMSRHVIGRDGQWHHAKPKSRRRAG